MCIEKCVKGCLSVEKICERSDVWQGSLNASVKGLYLCLCFCLCWPRRLACAMRAPLTNFQVLVLSPRSKYKAHVKVQVYKHNRKYKHKHKNKHKHKYKPFTKAFRLVLFQIEFGNFIQYFIQSQTYYNKSTKTILSKTSLNALVKGLYLCLCLYLYLFLRLYLCL